MLKIKSWTNQQLIDSVHKNKSIRSVIKDLGLKPCGGNYKQINKYIKTLKIDTSHFTGKLWNKGLRVQTKARIPIYKILVKDSDFQSHKLKLELLS